eukprot:scaffold19471_cov23-Tisochrysis_lutea.AAC.1
MDQRVWVFIRGIVGTETACWDYFRGHSFGPFARLRDPCGAQYLLAPGCSPTRKPCMTASTWKLGSTA